MARLEVLNARIGKPDAQPNDFEAIIATIHQLMSVLTIYLNINCPETQRARLWMEKRARMKKMSEQ